AFQSSVRLRSVCLRVSGAVAPSAPRDTWSLPQSNYPDDFAAPESTARDADSGLLLGAGVEADPDGDVIAGDVRDLHAVDDLHEIGRLRWRRHRNRDLVELGIERGRVAALDGEA